ncbi:hypothetical protein [[Phormidium] sp. ETS-05]|uniref:hypothetical protein n=1 Tax=[Phormidium] sp. ETS-05 TaxID=222819 RepID=UPI0018EEE615|nr:hypothetical protein [[Phormidium] sp. ETS-05]
MLKKLRNRILLGYAVVVPICLVMAGLMYGSVTIAQQASQAAIADIKMVAITERLDLGLEKAQRAAVSSSLGPESEFTRTYEQGLSLYKASAAQLKKSGANRSCKSQSPRLSSWDSK